MAQQCSVCTHPERVAIDAALAGGTSTRDVAGRYGTSKSAVDRHRQHMPSLVAPPLQTLHPEPEGFVSVLREAVANLRRLAGKAEKAKDYSAAVAANRETMRAVEIVVRAAEAQAERERAAAGELTDAELEELVREAGAELARRRSA